ncbi:DUF1127 domain-containing protein [Roseobacter sp. HKCCA0434]|uniref:DUF1127 domain-containing protein n=1 Tax=Roseobacter sp. HKCCA0434 TaxID=3079297 RepID=UPI002905B454|nr:DUF1127 domain-containing protein [Roseobacter sp. HKCCA0434]
MAMMSPTPFAPFGAETVYRVVSRVETAWLALRNAPLARITSRSLNTLSNRELEDVGLSRADIHKLSRRMLRRS